MLRRFSSRCVPSPALEAFHLYVPEYWTTSRSSPSIYSLERAERKFTKTVDEGRCTGSARAAAPCASSASVRC
eukprot:scaffold59112_cov33-Attheya_sp.AAC.4